MHKVTIGQTIASFFCTWQSLTIHITRQ